MNLPNRDTLFAEGKRLIQTFCAKNKLNLPYLESYLRKDWRFSACAYFRPNTIHICVPKCASIGTGGRAWSYPGYVVDRTPYGVLAHELGHYIDHLLSKYKGAYGGNFSINLRKAIAEPPITGYCPNDWEWFAEMFRLFVTNPDYLKALRPEFYRHIREQFEPAVDKPWQLVLKDAPERTKQQARKKIQQMRLL